MVLAECSAGVSATEKPPHGMVPPVLPGLTFSTPCPPRNMQISKLATTCAPVFFAISAASPMWSSWPWVMTTWVTPAVASSKSSENLGLPLRKGSIRIVAASMSMRKAEWPSQVSFIARPLVEGQV